MEIDIREHPIGGGLFIIAIGVIFILASLWMGRDARRLKQVCTAQESGVVIDFYVSDSISDGRRKYMYYPIVEYTAGDRLYTERFEIGSSSPGYREGQAVVIGYNPNAPQEFYIVGDHSNTFLIVVFSGAGGLTVLVGLSFIVRRLLGLI